MSFFGKLVTTVYDTATLPASIVKDIFTLGGVTTDSGESSVVKNLKKIEKDIEKL
jgi:hypothetical protein